MNMGLCPHCADPTESKAAFCASCGLAVTATFAGGPSLLEGDELAKTPVGRRLQHATLGQYCLSVANTLITIGAIQLFFCGLLFFLARKNSSAEGMFIVIALGMLGILFVLLGVWAYKAPLPAGIIGLVLYTTLCVLYWIEQISLMGQKSVGNPNVENKSFGIGFIIQLIIIGYLIKGIKAALTRRKLQQQMNNGN